MSPCNQISYRILRDLPRLSAVRSNPLNSRAAEWCGQWLYFYLLGGSENKLTMYIFNVFFSHPTNQFTFSCRPSDIPLFLHIALAKTDAFTTSWDKLRCSLLVQVSFLCCQPLCLYSVKLAIVFKFAADKSLLPYWIQWIITRRPFFLTQSRSV
jgi:hypothetical protein